MIFVGIDLGASAVKAVAIKSSGHKFYILDTHFFPLKLDVDEEKKALLRIGHLKTLAELYQHQEVRYIFCFSQNEISARRLFFPFKERYKIERSLSFEMEDKILFDYQKLISDFKTIQSSKERTDVLVFSVFRTKILNILYQLKSVGIEPFIVTCEAEAISNLFEVRGSQGGGNAVSKRSMQQDKYLSPHLKDSLKSSDMRFATGGESPLTFDKHDLQGSDNNVNAAAAKVSPATRGHDLQGSDNNVNAAAAKVSPATRGHDLQGSDNNVNAAAAKVSPATRGHDLQGSDNNVNAAAAKVSPATRGHDLQGSDNNVNAAAAKVSPATRGHDLQSRDRGAAESRRGVLRDSRVELYVKVGYGHTVVMPFLEGICHGVYSFEWGVSSCVRKLAIKYEIPLETAMEQFYEKGFVLTDKRGYTGSQIAFSGVIQEEFDHLIHKVHLLLLQLEGEYSWQCRKIIICGDGVQVRNLQVWLSSRWNVPVVRAESVEGFPSVNLRNNDEKQNNLLVALGSAMEGLKSGRSQPINFLKEEFAVKFNLAGVLPSQWKRPLLVGSCCFMLFFCYAYLRDWQSERLSSRIHYVFQQSSQQMAGLRRYQITVPKVRQFISGKQHLIKKMKLVEELVGIPSALDGMKEVSIAIRKKPAWNLEIKQLDIGRQEIKIYGTILKAYLKNLESNLRAIAKKGALKPLPILAKSDPSTVSSITSVGSDSSIVSFAYSYMRSGSNQL